MVGWLIEIQRYRLFRASERESLAGTLKEQQGHREVRVLFLSFAHSLARAHIELVLLLHLSHSLSLSLSLSLAFKKSMSQQHAAEDSVSYLTIDKGVSKRVLAAGHGPEVQPGSIVTGSNGLRVAMALSTRKRRTWF